MMILTDVIFQSTCHCLRGNSMIFCGQKIWLAGGIVYGVIAVFISFFFTMRFVKENEGFRKNLTVLSKAPDWVYFSLVSICFNIISLFWGIIVLFLFLFYAFERMKKRF